MSSLGSGSSGWSWVFMKGRIVFLFVAAHHHRLSRGRSSACHFFLFYFSASQNTKAIILNLCNNRHQRTNDSYPILDTFNTIIATPCRIAPYPPSIFILSRVRGMARWFFWVKTTSLDLWLASLWVHVWRTIVAVPAPSPSASFPIPVFFVTIVHV